MDARKIFIETMLYPAMEKLKGNNTRRNLAELKQTETWDYDRLKHYQAEKLKLLLKTCIRSVPAYRPLNITEKEIDSDPFNCLQTKIPVLQKKTFQLNADDYLNINADRSSFILNRTGGSTGQPTSFYMDRHTVEYYEAARWRGLSWYGITPGSRSIMIWGNPIELTKQDQKKYRLKDRYFKNRQVISAYDLSAERIGYYVDFIDHYHPEYLYGYATALSAFAEMMLKQRLKLKIQLKAVVSTSETLYPEKKKLLEQVFECPAANEYGARDAGILAYTCPEGSMHITCENAIIEVLHPVTMQPVQNGENGLVAVTDLNNSVQPRLRYILGDIGAACHTICGCKRNLPVLSNIEGREDALLVRADGTLVHGNFINQLTRKRQSILNFQLVQDSSITATVNVVLRPDVPDDSEEYLSDIREMLPGINITCKKVADIPPSASGKVRYAIRSFSLSQETG